MRGSNATGMVSDESESESDDDDDDDDDDVRAALPVRAAPPDRAAPVPAKAKAKKDVLDAWFSSSEEEVKVVDNAAPATKEVEVVEVSDKLDECT